MCLSRDKTQEVILAERFSLMYDKNIIFATAAVLPDGNGGFTACPALMTEEEAIRYLRLNVDSSTDAHNTLKYYRDRGELIAIQVGRKHRYRRQDLDDFLAKKSEIKKRRAN